MTVQGAQTNGTPRAGGAPELLSGPSNAARAQSRIRAGRESTLAALEQGADAATPAKPAEAKGTETAAAKAKPAASRAAAKPTEEATHETEVTETDAKPNPELDVDSDDTSTEESTSGEEGTESGETTTEDVDTSKRLATISAAEERARKKIRAERSAWEAERKKYDEELAPRLRKVQEFEALQAKIRRGPAFLVDAMRSLGLSDDDFEGAAAAIYSASKAGAADPARRVHAERLMRDRELANDNEATRKRIDDLEAKLAATQQQQAFETHKSAYIDHAVKAIGDDAPIAAALAAKNPAKLRSALWATTERLIEQFDGDIPDVADVVAAYETARRAELDELGIDHPTLSSKTKSTKQNSQAAAKQNAAKTLDNDLSTPRVPRPTKSDREHRAETLRMLESGRLE